MKKAGEILCDYVPMGSTENGRDCWAQEQVLGAMEEYAKQFKTNKLFEFVYCGMTEESSYSTISIHRTREGAEKAMNKHKENAHQEWKKNYPVGSYEPFPFGRFEDWDVKEIEITD